MSGNRKHSKKNLKIYVISFDFLNVVDVLTILLSFIFSDLYHHIYIFILNYAVI